jgi:ubiquinone/menaquinone biosynthesis C-methylase UbiE
MTKTAEDHGAFWSTNQPGFRFTGAEPGTTEFFRSVEQHRYALEPATMEMAEFPRWAEKDVLEVGSGIATDGAMFARHGARYTGIDFSPTAIELAETRFHQQQLDGTFRQASVTDLPFPDDSFDLVYSCGVIHHIHDTQRAIQEFQRVLRPGGQAELLEGHRYLLRKHGVQYLRDRRLFLNNNTDGPGNPLSKVYAEPEMREMFSRAGFRPVQAHVRYLNLRIYPGGARFSGTTLGRRLERRYRWHLWVHATHETQVSRALSRRALRRADPQPVT